MISVILRMQRGRKVKALTKVRTVLLGCFCLVSCWLPEKFDATLVIDKTRHYQFTYDGTLAFSTALDALKEKGRLSPEDDKAFQAEAAKMRKAKGVTRADYVGNGRMRVRLHEEGMVRPGTKFFMDLAEFQNGPNGSIRIVGPTIGPDERKQLEASGLDLDGDIRMTSALVVTEHNASTTPWFGGLWGAYKWHVDKNQKVTPTAVLK